MLRKLLLLINFFFLFRLFGDAHILLYHRFGDPRYPTTNTSLEQLRKDFTYLKEHNYKVIPLQKLVYALKNHQPIDPKWVVITIDDGFKSLLQALPIFKEFRYPFTLFISTKPIQNGYPDFLRWEDVKQIAQFAEIGLHSHAHPHLTDLSDEEIVKDTKKALNLYKKHLHTQPKSYAYPYGEYNDRIKKILHSFHFALCNQNLGAVSTKSSIYDLDRIALVGKSNLPQALRLKYLPAQWIKPLTYPKDGILQRVVAKIDPIYKNAKLYITGYGWRDIKVKDGLIDVKIGLKLTKRRVRVIIKVKHSKINTKILVRSRYGVK